MHALSVSQPLVQKSIRVDFNCCADGGLFQQSYCLTRETMTIQAVVIGETMPLVCWIVLKVHLFNQTRIIWHSRCCLPCQKKCDRFYPCTRVMSIWGRLLDTKDTRPSPWAPILANLAWTMTLSVVEGAVTAYCMREGVMGGVHCQLTVHFFLSIS